MSSARGASGPLICIAGVHARPLRAPCASSACSVVLGLLLCPAGLPLGVQLAFGKEERWCPVHHMRSSRSSAAHAARPSPVLRLRGGVSGSDEEADERLLRHVSSRVVMVPIDAKDLQDAVDVVEKRAAPDSLAAGEQTRQILVSASTPNYMCGWGTREDGFRTLKISGSAMSLRMEDGITLLGPMELQPSSGGTFTRWKWGCAFDFGLQQEAALFAAGGPWQMQRCVLRATDMPVVRAYDSGSLALDDSFVGGFSGDTQLEDGQAEDDGSGKLDEGGGRCTQALLVEDNATVKAIDCTMQYCGAFNSATVLAGGAAHLELSQCFLFQNLGCGISIHEAADVQAVQCSMMQLDGACFRAVLAHRAKLRLFNVTLQGQKWQDPGRPGTLHEEGECVQEPPTKRRRSEVPEVDPQAHVMENIDEKAAHTVEVWDALTQELAANMSEVIDVLEGYCNAAGATCRRARTGRQRLASPRYVMEEARLKHANYSADELLTQPVPRDDGPEWQDLPPILLADFSNLAVPSAQTTLCVYVHVEPLLLSALRDPSLIADGQALLIEHSDRFLSRRRFGGDAARIVSWVAAMQAFVAAGAGTPMHVKMMFDCLEEAHSSLLGKRLAALSKGADAFLRSVDYVCVMHGEWLTPWHPCLITAFRGLSTHFLTASAPWDDLHSGYFGGAVREPCADLVAVLSQLHFSNGTVSVPGLSSHPLSTDEKRRLMRLLFRDDAGQLPPGWEASPLFPVHTPHTPRSEWHTAADNASTDAAPAMEAGPGAAQAEGAGPASLAAQAEGAGDDAHVMERGEDEYLMALGRTWYRPSLTVHGISGGWTEPVHTHTHTTKHTHATHACTYVSVCMCVVCRYIYILHIDVDMHIYVYHRPTPLYTCIRIYVHSISTYMHIYVYIRIYVYRGVGR